MWQWKWDNPWVDKFAELIVQHGLTGENGPESQPYLPTENDWAGADIR